MTGPETAAGVRPAERLGWGRALATVVRMDLRQRLRTRSWYVLLGAWFVVIGLVTWAAFASYNVLSGMEGIGGGAGRFVFEAVVGFVLGFGLLVAPAVSASGISGDRAGGTLAVVQVTLLTPAQLLVGKWLASWAVALAFLLVALPYVVVSLVAGGLDLGGLVVLGVMVAVELGVVCALGTTLSAVASRTLFAVVTTYLLVALSSLGTVVAFALAAPLTHATVPANIPEWSTAADLLEAGPVRCYGRLQPVPALDTRSTYWLLAANPFVVVSDAVPTPEAVPFDPGDEDTWAPDGVMTSISFGVRHLQRPPEMGVPCAHGEPADAGREEAWQGTPVWPLGLGLQLAVVAGLFAWARQRLVAPATRLPRGTRVA
ncbi:ABC transporter permease [Citricoccus sp. SGAir0253]|uniref:ABC transporter permease n=1 Tax=Citricoccus sp. SGAir0253 TaxID=2567881 RepID=UPI0010CCFCB0|nr:ABC transporter permease [Citricoccus sp. SGAir0253]QCU79028.1 ABC transporter permease [Citricoccus sp. SGAir0253]